MYDPQTVNLLSKLQAQCSICADLMISAENNRLLADRYEKDSAAEKDQSRKDFLAGQSQGLRDAVSWEVKQTGVYLNRIKELTGKIFASKGESNGA